MADINETHPFLVSTWLPGNDNPRSLFEKGYWMEEARCKSKSRAEEVALCLSLRHPKGVQVAELVRDERGGLRWQAYKYWPESARDLMQQEEKRQRVAKYYLAVGTDNRAEKLRDCRSDLIEQAEQEAEEVLQEIRAAGDTTSFVRVIETVGGLVVYATGRKRVE